MLLLLLSFLEKEKEEEGWNGDISFFPNPT